MVEHRPWASPKASTASASPSPGARASSAPPWSSASCAPRPAASWSCSSARAGARIPPVGPTARSSATTPSTASARSGVTSSRPTIDRRVTAVAGDVGTDGLGLDDDGRAAVAACDIVIHSAATVSFDSPLDRRRRGQPPRPQPHRRRPQRPGRRRPTSWPSPPATWPAAAEAPPPRSWSRRATSSPTSPGGARSTPPAACAPTSRPASRTPEKLADFRKQARQELGRRRRAPAGREDRAVPEPLGRRSHGRGRAGPGRRRWAGPTPTPTRRRWASGPCSRPGATCP